MITKKEPEKMKFTGIFIPAELLKKKNINTTEKLIIADVGYFPAGYRFSNSKLADKFGVCIRTIINTLNKLRNLNYIIGVGPDSYHRCLKLNGAISALFEKTKGAKVAPIEKPKKGKKIYAKTSKEFELAKLLLDEIQKRKTDFKGKDLQVWAKHIDLMIRMDGRNPDRIAEVIRWCQADNGDGGGKWKGWQNNILSTEKLREKFDKLELQKDGRNPIPTQSTASREKGEIPIGNQAGGPFLR